ncbi:MAG: tRNA (adenosine(37)-N6)-threonylcarbamoyltransferase complex transferase subunit TsaD [Candidatus Omnitrophota bacterium]
MHVLGIETSCDETAAAVVRNGNKVLSNVVSSSVDFHAKYGGVIPEIASRFHVETIVQVAREALRKAKKDIADVDLIAVTANPGLVTSLLIGISFARALSFGRGVPIVEVDHTKAHLWAIYLEQKVRLPVVGLVVSGGHTNLYYLKDALNFIKLGATLDDACGEAFDKVATILGLRYPGGPIIDKLAQKGDPARFNFSCAELPGTLDFSFSGIKTAVLYFVRKQPALKRDSRLISDIAASFQKSVVDILVKKALLACGLKKTKDIIVGGGVAANSYLRKHLTEEAACRGIKAHFPSINFCLDNAAMIAGLGYQMRPQHTERK